MSGAISDVAALAGVSKATASRALTGRGYVSAETRERVVQAATTIGYVASPIASSLSTGRTLAIGVITSFLNRWYFGEVLEGAESALRARGYDLTLYHLQPDSSERSRIFDSYLANKRFDGMISIGIEASQDEIARLVTNPRPLVAIGGNIRGAHAINIDDQALGREATEHLITLGHTRIAHITGHDAELQTDTVHGRRLAGYLAAMEEAGLTSAVHVLPAVHSLPGGYEAAAQLLRDARIRPTAVFASTDEVAIGIIIAARRLGITVPAELSVIGIDGHSYAEMFALTTFEQQPRAQGARAVEILLEQLEDAPRSPGTVPDDSRRPLAEVQWPTRLIIRQTTTRPDPIE